MIYGPGIDRNTYAFLRAAIGLFKVYGPDIDSNNIMVSLGLMGHALKVIWSL